MTYSINFDILATAIAIYQKEDKPVSFTANILQGISEALHSNGTLNSSDDFFSYKIGAIILHNYTIKKKDDRHLNITLHISTKKQNVIQNLEDIEEIIWAVMPSCYSSEQDDIFQFTSGKIKAAKHYLLIEDVPSNITYKYSFTF